MPSSTMVICRAPAANISSGMAVITPDASSSAVVAGPA
jgi:hypothetical protein